MSRLWASLRRAFGRRAGAADSRPPGGAPPPPAAPPADMDEATWLACTHPGLMLRSLGERASERKLRLFACACCRSVWHLLPEERIRHLVENAECFADGRAGRAECETALAEARQAGGLPDGPTRPKLVCDAL